MKDKLKNVQNWFVQRVWLLALVWLLLPVVFSKTSYVMHILIMVAIYIMLSQGLNVIMGFAGQSQLGFAAFFGIGAYVAGILVTRCGWSFWPTLPLAFIGAFIMGGIIGLPSLRVRGDYLGIVTLGFGEITRIILTNWDTLTNGPIGIASIPSPTLFGLGFSNKVLYFYLATIFAALIMFLVSRIVKGKYGFQLMAVGHDERVAEVLGIKAGAIKVSAYALSSGFAGIAGALYATYFLFISPDSFLFNDSLAILCMVVVGGRGNVLGVVFGAVLLAVAPELFRFLGDYRMLMYGVILAVMVIFKPMGIWGMDKRKRNTIEGTCEKWNISKTLKRGL